jgi:signal transduction histidine kinase
VAQSEFQQETKEMTVPEGVKGINLSVVSGGNVDAVGILALDDIRITVIRNGVADAKPWVVADFVPDSSGKRPRDWKNYMRADMAELLEYPQGSGHHVLMLRDTSNTSYVEYNFQKALDETVRPGDRLRIQWCWTYSIGSWERNHFGYDSIPPGEYRLRVQSVSPDGAIVRDEFCLPVSVPVVFYKRLWFIVLGSLCGAAMILSVPFWLYRRRVKARLAHLAWINRLEQERTRIARDIHDSIGSRLTQIRLMAARLREGPASKEEQDELVAGVLDEALDAGRNLHEIIWTVKTENDTAEALAGYLAQTAQSLCGAAGIQCRLKIPKLLPEIPLTSQIRHNVMLTVREALTNAIKHSHASEIGVALRLPEGALEIEVHDNGAGFALADVTPGEGLANMRARMGEIAGTVEWLSQAGQGTTVLIRLPSGRTR